jgi:hypothetical protein
MNLDLISSLHYGSVSSGCRVGSASSYDTSNLLQNILNNPLHLSVYTNLSIRRRCSMCLTVGLVLLKYFLAVCKVTSVITRKLCTK